MGLKTAMRIRGMIKLVALVILAIRFLPRFFPYACHEIDPNVTPRVVSIFGIASSLMIGFGWRPMRGAPIATRTRRSSSWARMHRIRCRAFAAIARRSGS